LTRHLPTGEPDLVFIRLEFLGRPSPHRPLLRYDIIDKFDVPSGLSAMMRTTAFPASIVAQMMARGETLTRGAVPQELSIPPDAFVARLEERGIRITEEAFA